MADTYDIVLYYDAKLLKPCVVDVVAPPTSACNISASLSGKSYSERVKEWNWANSHPTLP